MGFQLTKKDIENIITCQPEAVERVLNILHTKIEKHIDKPKSEGSRDSPGKPVYQTSPLKNNNQNSSNKMDNSSE